MEDFLKNVGYIVMIIIIMILIGSVFGYIGYAIINHNNPPAIEVYRGNTTLEITYRDGIPVDSVVVYKSDKNK